MTVGRQNSALQTYGVTAPGHQDAWFGSVHLCHAALLGAFASHIAPRPRGNARGGCIVHVGVDLHVVMCRDCDIELWSKEVGVEMDGNGVRGEGREWHCDLVNSVRAERRAKERDAALLEREHNRRQVLDVPREMGVAVDRPDFHVLVKLVDHVFKPLLSEGHQLIARDDSVVVRERVFRREK